MTKPVSRKMAVDCLLYWFAVRAKPDGLGLIKLACTICGEQFLPTQAIQFDHIHADVFGGPHEYENLRPVHAECHKSKTKRDVADNAKLKRIRGERKPKPKRTWTSRKMVSRSFPKGRKMR